MHCLVGCIAKFENDVDMYSTYINETWENKTRVMSYKLRVQIHELQIQIYELRGQIHELRVEIHEL